MCPLIFIEINLTVLTVSFFAICKRVYRFKWDVMTTLTFSGMLGSSLVSGTVKKECWRKEEGQRIHYGVVQRNKSKAKRRTCMVMHHNIVIL